MEIVILPNQEEVSLTAARIIKCTLEQKPRAVLGFATGRTMLGVYRDLRGFEGFAQASTFNLDEYVGMGPEDEGSYAHYMSEQLFKHVPLKPENIHLLDGLTDDPEACCEAYEEAIKKAGGIDLQLLGIGENGHIAFNEPASSLGSRTRFKSLASSTLAANREFFPNGREIDIPSQVLTMGIGTILETRRCLLLANGRRKAQAVAAMAEGPVTAMCPASALQFHPRTVVLLDEEAALQLKLIDYYRKAYEDKPAALKY